MLPFSSNLKIDSIFHGTTTPIWLIFGMHLILFLKYIIQIVNLSERNYMKFDVDALFSVIYNYLQT